MAQAGAGTITSNTGGAFALLDNLLEGCQILSPEYRYVYVNEAVAKQGKSTKEKLIGHTMMEMYPGIERTEVFTHIKRCMEERVPFHTENEFEFPDKSKGWFELRIEPVPEGVFILSLDITERKRAEEVLKKEHIAEAREDFLFRTIHDLRAPTTIIQMALGQTSAKEFSEKYPEARELFEMVREVNLRMQKLIGYLFEFARGERDEIQIKKEPVDITALLQKELRDLAPIAAKKDVIMRFTPASNATVLGDPDSLKEVFENILDNAIKYNREHGNVAITQEVEGETVRIAVQDSGIGVDEADARNLFKPYFRAYTGPDIQGTGLGLFIVKGLVEKMGGTVLLSSRKGGGSVFTVTLPAANR